MTVSENESIASLKVLLCVAMADGVLHDEERKALEVALEAADVPGLLSLEQILGEELDLDAALAEIRSAEGRTEVYRSAYSLANADGECSAEEAKVLERVRVALGVAKEQQTLLGRLFAETKDTVLLSNIKPIADPARRSAEIREDTLKYAILSAILGAFPIPGVAIATDLAAVALQVKLVRDIGQYHGHKVDAKAAKTLLAGLGLGTGARIAVTNLVKLVPGWGSAVGAASSFAATYAVGRVMDGYFTRGAGDTSSLKDEFKAAEKEGKKAYKESKDAISAKEAEAKAKLDALNAEYESGAIDQTTYEKRAAELA
jgi:uncharacterized protein (DUF697 family)/tellurite resistance protein